MWRLIVIKLFYLFILLLDLAISSSSAADPRTQVHASGRVLEAQGAKHGYRYEVHFPSAQRKNIVSNRYQSTKKYEDNEISASVGSTKLAMSKSEYGNAIDSLQRDNLQPRNSKNTFRPNTFYLSPSSSVSAKDEEIKVENNNSKMIMLFTQQNPYTSSKSDDVLSIKNPDIYLPPIKVDSPDTNESEGYSYEQPTNQLTLPNESQNNGYFIMESQQYPPTYTNNEDDSIEVFPPTESPHSTWASENTHSQNYKLMASPEAFYNNLPQNQPQKRKDAYNIYKYDPHNSKSSLPATKVRPNSFPNSPYMFSSKNDVDESDSVEMTDPVSPGESSKFLKNINSEHFNSADVVSPQPETEIDEISKTSLMVHFAGSVFHAEGLPHPSKEMVFPVDYNFSYDLRGWPEMGHEETRAHTTTRGRYWVGLPDGRLQVVEYTAGPQGFMPKISYVSRTP